MAQNIRNGVNERLYCCRLQLDSYKRHLDDAQLQKTLIERWMGEATVYHLCALYRSYLLELSSVYNGPVQTFANSNELSVAIAASNIQTAEINELQCLEQNADSWLSQLLAYSPVPSAPALVNKAFTSISIVTVESAQSALEYDFLRQAFQSMESLIDNQRRHSEEW